MKIIRTLSIVCVTIGVLSPFVAVRGADAPPQTQPAATQPVIDPLADQILRGSCDFLAQSKGLAVHAEVWKDQILPSGHKIQVTRLVDLEVKRPDRFHVDAKAYHKGRSIWYDGKLLTVLDRENNLYGVVDAPASIDEAIEFLAEKYEISVPLEDFAAADPYSAMMKNVTIGGYIGDEPVLGVMCRHLAFSTDRVGWQIWIAEGPQPLPQKLVITHKTEDQSPQFTAIFSKWNLNGHSSDLAFEFIAPPGSAQIPLTANTAEHKHE